MPLVDAKGTAAKGHEVFAVLFLDAQDRLLAVEALFRGTLTQLGVTLLRNFLAGFGISQLRSPRANGSR